MKNIKKISIILVTIAILFCVNSLQVFATTSIQDGIDVNLTTNKENYSKDEQITTTLTITNTNATDVVNVSIENIIPKGYKALNEEETTKQIEILKSGENISLISTYIANNNEISQLESDINENTKSNSNNSINTGDDILTVFIAIVFLIISIIVILLLSLKNKKGKQLLSLTLSMSILINILSINSLNTYAIQNQNKSLSIENTILVNGDNIKIQSVINYTLINPIDNTNEDSVIKQVKALGLDNLENWNNYADDNNNGLPDCLENIMGLGTDHYDSDNDGLPDFFEDIILTDKNNPDSDGDGLPDGYEIFTLHTMPTKFDSDNNEIPDSDEDFDNDTLSNLEEYQLKTNPKFSDTDYDDLSDCDEVIKYKTDPLSDDTDNDNLRDSDELKYKMNPLNPDTLDDGMLDGDRIFTVTLDGEISDNKCIRPMLTIQISGKQIESLEVKKIDDSNIFLNSDIPGYLGNAYDLSVDGEFCNATLSFEIDKQYFEDDKFEPAIYYWDEEKQIFVELSNQILNGNIISAKLEHFSSYIVMSKTAYENAFLEYEIEAPTDEELQNKTFDIVLSLDESGSISPFDFNLTKELCADLIDKFSENDKIAIYTFDDSIRKITGFTDKNSAISSIKKIDQHEGATALYSAMNAAINEFSNLEDIDTKIVISLTDGYDNASYINANSIINSAIESSIIIYTVGIGSYVNSTDLKDIAESTGGQYYNTSNFSELAGVFDRIVTNADLYKDSDDDGISDYHEKKIANGELKCGTGASISNFDCLNYLNDDSDKDEILDGDEIEISSQIINGKQVYYCYLNSNPCLEDSDNDGLNDFVENYAGFNPLINNIQVSASTQSSSDLLKGNNFYEWLNMANNHSWNYIHNAVEKNIRDKNIFLYAHEYSLKNDNGKIVGRIDLIDSQFKNIWDVKPASYQYSPNKEKGDKQLDLYIKLASKNINGNLTLSKGGKNIPDSSFEYGGYTITYRNTGTGLIVYNFKNNVVPKPEEVPIAEDEKQKESEKETYNEVTTISEWGWACVLVGIVTGVGITIGTIIEDFGTLGVGVADDIPSFAAAEEIIRQSLIAAGVL